MTNIEFLIKKYYKPDGKNMTGTNKKTSQERYTETYRKNENIKANLKHRHNILSELLTEIPFTLTTVQTEQIRYWIDTFNNTFKDFHRQSSNETIILAMIMIQAKRANSRLNVEQYNISTKYNLTSPIFELIQNRLIFQLMRTTPLTYNQRKHQLKENPIKRRVD